MPAMGWEAVGAGLGRKQTLARFAVQRLVQSSPHKTAQGALISDRVFRDYYGETGDSSTK